MTITIGIDIGQRRDPTAICVAELVSRPGPMRPETHYLIRHLDRLPLRTPYSEIASRLRDLCDRVSRQTADRPTVFVDATGVGLPVVDVLKATVAAATIVPVFFTHGDRRTEESGEVRLGKAFLVSRLQALLQRKFVFRGSIARPSPSLSTLRRRPCGAAHARLASGWWPAFARRGFPPPGPLRQVSGFC